MATYRIYTISADRRATLRAELRNTTGKHAFQVALLLLCSLPEGETCWLDCDPDDNVSDFDPPMMH